MPKFKIRKSSERGYANHGWLESYHSFSFAEYFDRRHMYFSVLRVMNDDLIAPASGFDMHSHRDMEIITYILEGELRHQDSLGNGSVIRAGDVQRMTAGTGIVHSEVNASDANPVHLLQIWIFPEQENLMPGYEEKHFEPEHKLNRWCLIASPDAQDHALKVHQDMRLYASRLQQGAELDFDCAAGRSFYLHLASGSISINQHHLQTGDAMMFNGESLLQMKAHADSELLLFDMPLHVELGERKR